MDELRRRCIVNGEAAGDVAGDLGVEAEQAQGAVRLLRACPALSTERAATVVMRDWGMEDEDIAEIFGRPLYWAQLVRERRAELEANEPIPTGMDYLDSGLQPGDPSPEEIYALAMELRRTRGTKRNPQDGPAIRSYQWTGYAFIPNRAG